MVEYVDIAHRLAAGEGYLLGIKAYHVGSMNVIDDGLYHRPPLLTVAIAALFWLGLDVQAVQVVHTLVAALSTALVCSIGTVLFGRRVGILAGILAAANPLAFKMQVPLMTEALASLLILAGVRLLIGAFDRPTLWSFALAGLTFGLGYLARPPVLAVFLATTVAMVVISGDRQRLRRPLVALFTGLALVIVPMSLFTIATRDRLIYSGKTYLYAVVSDRSVIEEGFAQAVPTPAEFITSHASYIVQACLNLAVLYAKWLFFDPEWLLALLPGWPFALWALRRGQYPRTIWLVLAAAVSNYVFYSLTWSTWQDRFLLPTLLLVLPLGVDGLIRAIRLARRYLSSVLKRPLPSWASTTMLGTLTIAAIVLAWFPDFLEQYRGSFAYFDRPAGTRVDDGFRWTAPPRWVNDDDLQDVTSWALSETSPDAILAASQPWPLSFFSRRPSVLIPLDLNSQQLEQFIVEYRVAYMLLDGRDRPRRIYREYLENRSDRDIQATKIGAVTVYDTRSFWDRSLKLR